jgi:hypothetical protein
MLIQLQAAGILSEEYPSPIVGLRRLEAQAGNQRPGNDPIEHTPTSADVHLYADSRSIDSRTPLLYADCEGLEGGESPPIGARENRKSRSNPDSVSGQLTPGRKRSLAWATAGTEREKRSYIVKQLYPRILYTLSDVVVFVMHGANSKYVQRLLWVSFHLRFYKNIRGSNPAALIAMG